MKYKRLGKTGLVVSSVGYGALGAPGLSPKTVRAALEGGINYIDSARKYKDSELKIGKALKDIGNREKIVISTKSSARELAKFQADFATSLELLGTDYIDIYMTHDVSTEENWRLLRENGIVDWMAERKAQGGIRHLGCSTHDEKIGRQIIESGLFEVIMLAYNAANPELEHSLIPLAKSRDMGIVIMKPLGGGVLTDKRSRELGFAMSAEEAPRFAMSGPDVGPVIPGLDSLEYVELALKVWNEDAPLSPEQRQELVDNVTIKGRNYCRGCGYCLPCPKDIPIPQVLALHNRWEVYYQAEWAQMHVISAEFSEKIPPDRGPEECVGCGACSTRCPYNLPIPALMENCKEMRM